MEQVAALGSTAQHAVAGAAYTGGARPLGRNAAPSRGRDRRHAAAVRFRRADADCCPTTAASVPTSIVHLPGGKQIVVDAKTPLEAFLDAQECTDEEARRSSCRRTRGRCATTWTSSGARRYWEQLGNSPEMVVMFLPGETLFSAALQHDLTLIEYGLRRRCCWPARSR